MPHGPRRDNKIAYQAERPPPYKGNKRPHQAENVPYQACGDFAHQHKRRKQQDPSLSEFIHHNNGPTAPRMAAKANMLVGAGRCTSPFQPSQSVIETPGGFVTAFMKTEPTEVTLAQIYQDIETLASSGITQPNGPNGGTQRQYPVSEYACKVIEIAANSFRDRGYDANIMSSNRFFHSYNRASQKETELGKRFANVTSTFGWTLLSMLGHSVRFRSACYDLDSSSWNLLMHALNQNKISLELFFKVRCLDWITPLQRNEKLIPRDVINACLQHQQGREVPAIYHHNPHSYVLPSGDGRLHRANYQGIIHQPASTNTFNHRNFPIDPSLRSRNDTTKCAACNAFNSCTCQTTNNPAIHTPLVELIQNPATDKGVGVRTLQRIHKGTILGEYVGELTPASAVADATYARPLEVPALYDGFTAPVVVDAKVYGNWTRYIASSASPSLRVRPSIRFAPMLVGKRYRIMVLADRDVEAFEELVALPPGLDNGFMVVEDEGEGNDERMCDCGDGACGCSGDGMEGVEYDGGEWRLMLNGEACKVSFRISRV
ncbi:MAG: hypothetical protein Q9222_003411 [Ikaeria aurantiellina]